MCNMKGVTVVLLLGPHLKDHSSLEQLCVLRAIVSISNHDTAIRLLRSGNVVTTGEETQAKLSVVTCFNSDSLFFQLFQSTHIIIKTSVKKTTQINATVG